MRFYFHATLSLLIALSIVAPSLAQSPPPPIGSCSPQGPFCGPGYCCSNAGYCGTTSDYCAPGNCQSQCPQPTPPPPPSPPPPPPSPPPSPPPPHPSPPPTIWQTYNYMLRTTTICLEIARTPGASPGDSIHGITLYKPHGHFPNSEIQVTLLHVKRRLLPFLDKPRMKRIPSLLTVMIWDHT